MSSVVSPSKKIILLHYLRGVAALMVLYVHLFAGDAYRSRDATLDANIFVPIIPDYMMHRLRIYHLPFAEHFGSFGVDVFFLMTGFVIALAMEKHDAKTFCITRFFRIYPCYIACFLLGLAAVLFSGWLIHGTPVFFDLDRVLAELTISQDFFDTASINTVVWTLMMEVRYYMVMMVVIALFPGQITLKKVLCLAWIYFVTIFTFQLLDSFLSANYPYTRLVYSHVASFAHYDLYILIGTVFFLLYRNRISRFTAFGTIALIVYEFTFLAGLFHHYTLSASNPSLWTALVTFAICVLFASRFRWESRVLDFFGNISFPLYATHFLIGTVAMSLLVHRTRNVHLSLWLTVILCVGLASFINVYVEEPANRIGKKIAAKVERHYLKKATCPHCGHRLR